MRIFKKGQAAVPARKKNRSLHLGKEVPGAETLQLEIPIDRAGMNKGVHDGVQVVLESRQGYVFAFDFIVGAAPAAHRVPPFENNDLLPGAGQIAPAGETIVTAADYDEIECFSHYPAVCE